MALFPLSFFSQLKDYYNKNQLIFLWRSLSLNTPTFYHIPNHPWVGDFTKAHRLLERFQGIGDDSHAKNMWEDASVKDSVYFHAFTWLSDLRAVGDNQSRRFMRRSILNWIRHYRHYQHLAWQPHVVGERLSSWMHHFEFFGQSADDDFLNVFYKSFYHQFRFLQTAALHLDPSYESLTALKGLILCLLAYNLPLDKKYNDVLQKFNHHLQQNLFRDGFFVTCEPDHQLTVIKHLIELRNFMRVTHYAQAASKAQHTMTKMVPPLRFFRHGDGRLSSLVGGESHYSSSMVDSVLALSDVKGRHPQKSEEAGLERFQVGHNILLFSMRYHPFPAQSSGNLQCEWSNGKDRLIKLCDMILENQKGRPFQSRSMAHVYKKIDPEHVFIEAKIHDINHLHTREMYLSEAVDLRVCEKIRVNQKAYGALRFIIDSAFTIELLSENQGVTLIPVKGQPYRLQFSYIDEIIVDTTMALGGEGDNVIFALFELNANTPKEIKWSFSQE